MTTLTMTTLNQRACPRPFTSAHRSIDLKRQVQASEPGTVIGKTVEKMEGLLGASGASLVYAGYPYDPFA
jgi:hypothetical protein